MASAKYGLLQSAPPFCLGAAEDLGTPDGGADADLAGADPLGERTPAFGAELTAPAGGLSGTELGAGASDAGVLVPDEAGSPAPGGACFENA